MIEQDISTVTWIKIAQQIRQAEYPNQCELVDNYINLASQLCEGQPTHQQQMIYTKVFTLLLDTMSDVLIAEHWRLLCLNNLYRPLFALKRIAKSAADKSHVDKLLQEYARMSHYCFG